MLTNLRIQGFRCYSDHSIPFKPHTLIVGKNNAGKSSLVDALRIVSTVAARARTMAYQPPPPWLADVAVGARGVAPSLDGLEITEAGLFHRYGEPPATITATTREGATITAYVGPGLQAFGVVRNRNGVAVVNSLGARELAIGEIAVMPPLGPIVKRERLLAADYVRRTQWSDLSSGHFRNEVSILRESYPAFRQLAENTWPGLMIQEIRREVREDETYLNLFVRERDFEAELGWMGEGLKTWLQILWFLSRTDRAATIILDEPDVHIHPDLQRRLMDIVRSRGQQTIVATHSVEILADAEPETILVIDRTRRHSGFAASLDAVQTVLDRIGTAHNLQLARLWAARRFLLVEGKDVEVLAVLHSKLFPEAEALDRIPSMEIGGWSNWPYAVGTSMALQNAAGQAIKTYCVLDRDFHTPSERQRRLEESTRRGLALHIWERKEIENYLIEPAAIARLIRESARRPCDVDREQVETKLDAICEDLYFPTIDAFANEYWPEVRELGVGAAGQRARDEVDARWMSLGDKLKVVSGKEVLARVAAWATSEFGATVSTRGLARALRPEEVDPEVFSVLRSITLGEAFSDAGSDVAQLSPAGAAPVVQRS